MLKHYLKIAFRNLWKYKTQNIISIIGLAVGFTCFALATLWIRYEMTFDSFLKNAKQMYVVYVPNNFNADGYGRNTCYPLAAYLKETFPEIIDAISVTPAYSGSKVIVDDVESPAQTIDADSSFLRMFDVKIIEGNQDFLIFGSNKLAITQEKARQLFGSENPIGKIVSDGFSDHAICAIVSGIPKQSNYAFDFIEAFPSWLMEGNNYWFGSNGGNTIIELAAGTDIKTFEKKLYELNPKDKGGNIKDMRITPLTKLRYTGKDMPTNIKFQYILIFSIAGSLVILCSLFNYLTLFISRFRIRQKELALRMVCGASGRSLLAMLSVEYLLTMLLAVLLGYALTRLIHQPFLELSGIQMALPSIYLESLVYVGAVILISLFVFWFILFIFQRRSLNISIRQSNKKLFRKISVIVQLMISIVFAFCTIIILKQIYFLHHTDELGFSFQNRGSISIYDKNFQAGDISVLVNHLKQIPEVTEVVGLGSKMVTLLPINGWYSTSIYQWEDMPTGAKSVVLDRIWISPQYVSYYDFRLAKGEMLTDMDPDSLVLINESVAKAFGWRDPVGKLLGFDDTNRGYRVKGVIKDVYNFGPIQPVRPAYYAKPPGNATPMFMGISALFQFEKGMWKPCEEKINRMLEKEYPNFRQKAVLNTEEEYNKYLKSENALIQLLSFLSAICILICVFGFVSLVSLTCEERRKAIAIRKINGATVGDILAIFAKEYFLLLIIGATIAFPAGYLIMQRWLENYMKQATIPAWIYFSILFVLALLIVLCVGWQVYKTSIENPAEVVKRE